MELDTFYCDGGHTSRADAAFMNDVSDELGYLLHKNHPHNLESDLAEAGYSKVDMRDVFEALIDWVYDYNENDERRIDTMAGYDIDYLENLEDRYNAFFNNDDDNEDGNGDDMDVDGMDENDVEGGNGNENDDDDELEILA